MFSIITPLADKGRKRCVHTNNKKENDQCNHLHNEKCSGFHTIQKKHVRILRVRFHGGPTVQRLADRDQFKPFHGVLNGKTNSNPR